MRKEQIMCSAEVSDSRVNYFILEKELNECTGKYEWGIKIAMNNESESVSYFSDNYERVEEVIDILSRNKVTPISFFEVMDDIMAIL